MKLRQKSKLWLNALCVWAVVNHASTAWAFDSYGDQPTTESFVFKLITSGLGAFVIIFFGLGGLASIYLTRSGESGRKTPILGVVMLLMAGVTFAYRVAIRAGMMGHEYIQW